MPTLDPEHGIHGTDRYWRVLRDSFREIFGGNVIVVDELRAEIDDAQPDQQLLFYHIEPFDVAVDLANERDADTTFKNQHLARYRTIAQRLGWP